VSTLTLTLPRPAPARSAGMGDGNGGGDGTAARLRDIVRRARPLAERLAASAGHVPNPAALDAARKTLAAWREVVAGTDPAAFARRLAYDGLSEEAALAALAPDAPAPQGPLPGWAVAVAHAYGWDGARAPTPGPGPDRALCAGEPLPFEEVLLPLLRHARAEVLRRAAAAHGEMDEAAHAALERALLRRLSQLGSRALFTRFSVQRSVDASLSGLGALFGPGAGRAGYQRFAGAMERGGMLELFATYPVLARLLGTAVELWVEMAVELLERVRADRAGLDAAFGGGRPLGTVAAVEAGASDFHDGGRSVVIATFASGVRVVYKPRALAIEPAYAELVAWINARGDVPALRTPAVLCRPTHGWLEFVEARPCASTAEVERYFTRAGALLALVYALGGSDFHHENVLACGDQPVLIDLEGLLSHRFALVERVPNQAFGAEVARRKVLGSVVFAQMLPYLKLAGDGAAANAGAFGSVAEGDEVVEAQRWQHVNADAMRLGRERMLLRREARSLPVLDGAPVPGSRHVAALADGFSRMYRLLARDGGELVAPGGVLHRLRGQPVRFILRNTSLYQAAMERCLHPSHLGCGAARSVQLDALCRPFLTLGERPDVWPALAAEHQGMERLDVPLFSPLAGGRALPLGGGAEVPGAFELDAVGEAVRRLGSLCEADLALQLELVHGAFRADAQRDLRVRVSDRLAGAGDPPAFLAETALREAEEIAGRLAGRALWSPGGEAAWLGTGYVPRARRFELGAAPGNLFDGYLGTAFFLAALERVAGAGAHGRLARAALRPLTAHVDDYALMFRMRRGKDLGAGTGIGSVLYGLTYLAGWLDEPQALAAAHSLAAHVPVTLAAGDPADAVSGAAGAVLGLLALHRRSGSAAVLEQASRLGTALLALRARDGDSGLMAWPGARGEPETGFAHGQAGIACALDRLAALTGDGAMHAAAAEARAWESLRLGGSLSAAADDDLCAAWARGTAGVGLARLGAAAAGDTAASRDVDAAIGRTGAVLLEGADTLCSGAMGRLDLLLSAGRTLGRGDLVRRAGEGAAQVVERARAEGGYRTGWEPYPHFGLFMGLSGIGYQLLRIAHPDRLPSVLLAE